MLDPLVDGRGAVLVAHLSRLLITHVPPRRRGMRLANASARRFGTPNKLMRVRHMSGYSVTCDLSDGVGKSLFYTGSYEPRLTKLIEDNLGPGEVLLDLGANAGHFTFLAASIVGPRGRVHAIEASPVTADLLASDIERNGLGGRITLHRLGAGDGPGRLRVVESPGGHPSGSRWLDPSSQGAEDGIPVAALDDVIHDSPHVVKIDIEGADLRALHGMRRLIVESRPRLILIEALDEQLARFGDSTEGILAFLENLGYMGELIDDDYYATMYAFRPVSSSPV